MGLLTYVYTVFVITCVILISDHCSAMDSLRTSSGQIRQKRSVVTLYQMVNCVTHCDPVSFKGYGCYCGFMGSGTPVDGLDRCCQQHDLCYERSSSCAPAEHYFAPYKFQCNYGKPACFSSRRGLKRNQYGSCGERLCECDVKFAHCINRYGCPRTKALCRDAPWRYFSNKVVGQTTGSGTHFVYH